MTRHPKLTADLNYLAGRWRTNHEGAIARMAAKARAEIEAESRECSRVVTVEAPEFIQREIA